jgi:hypothetical protein
MASENINVQTSSSQLFDEYHCFIVLICVEECDGLNYGMKQEVCKTNIDLPCSREENGWCSNLGS